MAKANNSKAILALEDGTYFEGKSFGSKHTCEGEVCFNTSMTGYQEILTDPSYSDQIVTMTYPEIGNYGINLDDVESKAIQVSGFVIKNLCEFPSNWRNSESKENLTGKVTLSEYLEKNGIPGIWDIDTRKLVRILREKGALTGVIASGDYNLEDVLKRATQVPSMEGKDLVQKVTVEEGYPWDQGDHPLRYQFFQAAENELSIVVLDFGVKYNILRRLRALGAKVTVLPGNSSLEEIRAQEPDGVLLSNGPGDPEPVDYAIENIKGILGQVPIFGICLGHQLLSLALGGKTYKLKFGHRGANHPIKNLKTGEIAITSQNHGFAVEKDSFKDQDVEITHMNLNDNTVAGIRHKTIPAFSVQYHPEASPGPKDSEYLFREFVEMVVQFQKTKVT